MMLKAISLWQPWASAMPLGLKSIETRHWNTSHRGPMVIHAAKKWNAALREFAEELGLPADLPLGALVAVGNLVRIEKTHMLRPYISSGEREWGDYANGRYGWVFKDITPLPEPVPYRGAQGIFEVPADVLGMPLPPALQPSLI